MKVPAKIAVAGFSLFALLQMVRPSIPSRPASREVEAPPGVKQILEKDCYSCHSDERRLAWFDEIVPAYWLVRHDVLTARRHLDFSTLGSKPPAAQRATLFEAVNMIQLGAMPLPQFVQLHPEARVTPEELATLKSYLAPWRQLTAQPATMPAVNAVKENLAHVQPEWNGVAFDPAFESWKLISVTDRGDNNTLRFILGNDVAVKAAQSGNISPWPDGSRFAKIAWQKSTGSDGLVRPGGFIQVELMVKDAARYKRTDGWGWGRWRGAELKPYGSDARFVNECTGCHEPVRGNDYVYTLPITKATAARRESVNNRAASVDTKLVPLDWSPITLYADPATRTTAVLFGNDAALRAVNTRTAQAGTGPVYPAGAALALVTWAQRDDPHWFGARIPDAPVSVELLQVESVSGSVYRRFTGEGQMDTRTSALAAERTKFMLGLVPARMP